MQVRASREAKSILRALRLSCASVGIAVGKILAHSIWQRKAEANAKKPNLQEMRLGRTEDEPHKFGVEEQDSGGDDPRDGTGKSRVGELAHLGAVPRKSD